MSINHVIEVGNITRDPELRTTANGTSVLVFSIAVNDRVRNQETQEWQDRPNYFDCVLYGNRANALSNLLTKGMKVAVEGKLRWRQWEKDGQKRSKIEIITEQVEFLKALGQAANDGAIEEFSMSDEDIDF